MEHMLDNNTVDYYLTHIKDLREQLINIDELIPDSSLVSTVLMVCMTRTRVLPLLFILCQTCKLTCTPLMSWLCFFYKKSSLARTGKVCMHLFLLTTTTRANLVGVSCSANPMGKAPTPLNSSSSQDEETTKKKRCNYSTKLGHLIEECRKRIVRVK